MHRVHVFIQEARPAKIWTRFARLILTHLGDDLLARLGEVELEVAYDGLEVLL